MSRFLPLLEMWAAVVALATAAAAVARTHAGYVRPHLRATTGVVAGQKFVHGDEYSAGGYVPTLEFAIETGQLVRARARGKPLGEPLEEGAEVAVVYRRDNPSRCYVGSLDDHAPETDVGVWATCLGVGLVGGLLFGSVALVIML
ncbi:DUF3592 domain-containing protein [Streptomyces sp. IBSBF 2806]|uniref:DUF3592 domain-containing protein n=1 Tax=Streptomyces sp. IBSBF 2806 TaxID=2903529 RepID=UPI002FDC49C5